MLNTQCCSSPPEGNIRMCTALWGKQGRAWAQGASAAHMNGKGGHVFAQTGGHSYVTTHPKRKGEDCQTQVL